MQGTPSNEIGESHLSDAHKQAQERYSDAMQAEEERYRGELAQLGKSHEERVQGISKQYTDALAAAGESAAQID